MTFVKGNKLSNGRPKGVPNKRTVAFFETIQEAGFDPAKAMLDVYEDAKKSLDYCNREERPIYLKLAFDAAKEIASYCYPKLKSIEHSKPNPLDGMTPEQKLEAMRQAVLLLEGEVKKDGSSSTD